MKTKELWKAVLMSCVVLVFASGVMAQDWPQWRGPARDGMVSDFDAPGQWPAELTKKWSVTVGSGDATPALVGDKLYLSTRQGEEEVTLCLNAADGKEIWSDKYAAQAVGGPARSHPGPRSSPAVADGKVVTMGVAGVVSCLDAASGKVIWRKDAFPGVVPRFFAAFSPIIVDGMAIAHAGGPGKGAIIAFDLAGGDEKWRWGDEGPDYGSPVLATIAGAKQIVTPTEKSIVGINVADGKLLWQFPFSPPGRAYNAATPIVGKDVIIVTGAGRGTKALKIENQDVKEQWSNPDLATQFNTPVLRDGLLFGLSNQNNLFCIDAQTGQTAWADTGSLGSRGFGSIVCAGSCLIGLTNGSELVVFKPDRAAYSEIKRYKVSDTEIYSHPVVAGNRIFIKDQETVTMWTI